MTIALIDADIVAWRCAASCEPNKEKHEREPQDLAILRADELLYRICNETQADTYRLFISGSENFRYAVNPDYKANRRGLPRPEWLDATREFLVREWGAEITDGYEADDGIGIAFNENSIICSIDKDLRQIAGRHFNFVTSTSFEVDDSEATLNFWMAFLTGDRSDNIRGIHGVGPVKANKALCGKTAKEMEDTVRNAYQDRDWFHSNYRLLRVLRSHQEYEEVLEEIREGKFSQGKREALAEASGGGDPIAVPEPHTA